MVVCKIFMSIRTTVSKRYILPTGLFVFCFVLFCFVALLIERLTVGERSKCFVPTLKKLFLCKHRLASCEQNFISART